MSMVNYFIIKQIPVWYFIVGVIVRQLRNETKMLSQPLKLIQDASKKSFCRTSLRQVADLS